MQWSLCHVSYVMYVTCTGKNKPRLLILKNKRWGFFSAPRALQDIFRNRFVVYNHVITRAGRLHALALESYPSFCVVSVLDKMEGVFLALTPSKIHPDFCFLIFWGVFFPVKFRYYSPPIILYSVHQ